MLLDNRDLEREIVFLLRTGRLGVGCWRLPGN
jgi:hypothetical protein